MMETTRLIEQLAAGTTPVRPLLAPWARACLWLLLAIPSTAIVVTLMSPRPDLASQFADLRFMIEEIAAVATAVLAAFAAFVCTVPGQSRKICVLPIVPLAIWLASVGVACVEDWLALGPKALALRIDWECMRAAIPAGILPAIVMVAMLRQGAPVYPRAALASGALAVGALANAGLQLYHAGDISVMVLIWHFGSVALLSAIAAWAGRFILRWPDAASILRELSRR
jgi:hypothetical protein